MDSLRLPMDRSFLLQRVAVPPFLCQHFDARERRLDRRGASTAFAALYHAQATGSSRYRVRKLLSV